MIKRYFDFVDGSSFRFEYAVYLKQFSHLVVDDLVRRRVVVELDGKRTPLVLTAPVAELPNPLQFPGGTVLSDELFAAE